MNLIAYVCDDELKRENLSLNIALNNNPRCNMSNLYDISANLLRNNAL